MVIIQVLWVASAYPYGARPEHIAADSVWLLSLQDKYREVDSVFSDVQWEFFTTGIWPDIPDKYYRKSAELALSRYNFKKYDRIRGEFGSPEMNRVARLMFERLIRDRNRYLYGFESLGPSLLKTMINFRPDFEGDSRDNNFLMELLRTESDRERRKRAWYSYREIGCKIAPGLQTLIKERNKIARKFDFRDYYEFQIEAMGMTEDDLFSVLSVLDSVTREPYEQIEQRRKLSLGIDNLEPWDWYYSLRHGPVDFNSRFKLDSLMIVLDMTLAGLGYPMDRVHITYDIYPRLGKSQSAYCFPVGAADDIRIGASVADGFQSYSTVFHEVGHALHFSFINQPYYALQRSPSECFSEAMAIINSYLLYQPEWLGEYAGIPDSLMRSVIAEMKDARIARLRNTLALVYFERELYRTDAEAPAELYWNMMSDMMLYSPQYDSDSWATVHHYIDKPVYLHNYILGELIAAHTIAYLRKINSSIIGNEKTSEFLMNEYYEPGASLEWFELIENATGEPLNARYLIEDLLKR
jgi:peptidyl-dipeptidase A